MKHVNHSIRNACAALLLAASAVAMSGCQDFLDVNTNPNTPETVSANLYLAPILHWWVTSPAYDGRYVGRYTQMFDAPNSVTSTTTNTTPSRWDMMGYDPGSDNGAEQWRDVYWSFGQNLIDMMDISRREERWDILGVGYLMKAWGWMVLTDLHGPIIKLDEAFDQSRLTFDYDAEQHQYEVVLALLDTAITNLSRTDGAVDAGYMAVGDKIYNGDRTKWLKAAWGVKAMALNHLSNKGALYKPADVIAAVDKSFASNADDALLTYTGVGNDDSNFFSRVRNNITSFRQTQFIVGLMDGTQFGGTVDPRMSRMLAPSPDGQYRGLDPNVGNMQTALPTAQRPDNFFGYPTTGGLAAAGVEAPARYIFATKTKFPNMTYAELQFIKAEAAYRMGDKGLARSAYLNGIGASIDFVNARITDDGQMNDHPGAPESNFTPISAAEKDAFLASPNIAPANITLSDIMSQKYIALWMWGFNEIWLDMRRYHYTDTEAGQEVFRGFTLPSVYYVDNAGKQAYRIRPRYNSEYVWNQYGLAQVGALASDYHTEPLWIIQP